MPVLKSAMIGMATMLCAVCTPAAAQTVDAANPASVVSAVQAAGYKALLTKDKTGDPKITSAANGADFDIYFYGCEANVNCKSLQLSVGYTIKTNPPLTKMNEWNQKNRFGTAYLDEGGDPYLQFDIVLVGGVSQQNFSETLVRWTDTMATFQTFIGW